MKKKKEILYCPKKQGEFKMMFGFSIPYIYARRKSSSGIKEVSVNLKSIVKL